MCGTVQMYSATHCTVKSSFSDSKKHVVSFLFNENNLACFDIAGWRQEPCFTNLHGQLLEDLAQSRLAPEN